MCVPLQWYAISTRCLEAAPRPSPGNHLFASSPVSPFALTLVPLLPGALPAGHCLAPIHLSQQKERSEVRVAATSASCSREGPVSLGEDRF